MSNFSAVRFPERNPTNNIDLLIKGMTEVPLVLRQMGYDGFRKGQQDVVTSILSQRDTLCILPTGSGKSACFIVPTLALGWRTIVFSPLVALMRDQVRSLYKIGANVAQMSSTQTDGENTLAARRWMRGELQFLYVAPERLRNQWFIQALQAVPADMVVVDEAHCLSQWSDNFRPDYCNIGDFIREKQPKVVAAFTATCPKEVEEDIRRVLCLTNAVKKVYYPRRTNLKLMSDNLSEDADIVGFLKRYGKGGQSIVYCSTIKKAEEMAVYLQTVMGADNAGVYHGELTPAIKRATQDAFMDGKVKIMVATNAFGMGIDKQDIRAVVHRNIPGSLEALSQEVGRAGRDGGQSWCMTFFDNRSLDTQRFFIACQYPSRSDIEKVFGALERLRDRHGVITATYDQISKTAGIPTGMIFPVLSNLMASAVIERHKPDSKCFKIKLLGMSTDSKFTKFRDAILELGVENANGELEVDNSAMVERIGLSATTVTNYLKKWHTQQVLYYEPPFRGAQTKIIGDINRVEFERLKLKHQMAYEKLNKVVDYVNTPDEQKHAFLEEYFNIEYNELA